MPDDTLITDPATRWTVVMWYGDGINDYSIHYALTEQRAMDLLESCGYEYTTTYGRERCYMHPDNDCLGSMSPEDMA